MHAYYSISMKLDLKLHPGRWGGAWIHLRRVLCRALQVTVGKSGVPAENEFFLQRVFAVYLSSCLHWQNPSLFWLTGLLVWMIRVGADFDRFRCSDWQSRSQISAPMWRMRSRHRLKWTQAVAVWSWHTAFDYVSGWVSRGKFWAKTSLVFSCVTSGLQAFSLVTKLIGHCQLWAHPVCNRMTLCAPKRA